MTRSQRQGVILAGLIGVMIAVYARALRPSADHGEPAAVVAEPPPVSPSAAPPVPERSPQRAAQREYAAHLVWGRDPFTRHSDSRPMSGLTLSGIIWDETRPMAIINGQMVHVGGECEGYRVTEIGPDRISVTDGIETFQLQIAP